jgi:adenylylsulfate kinase-like enzyme
MKPITVVVASTAGAGKSTVAQIIQEALNGLGISNEINDMEPAPNSIGLTQRAAALKGRVHVTIKVAQVARNLV